MKLWMHSPFLFICEKVANTLPLYQEAWSGCWVLKFQPMGPGFGPNVNPTDLTQPKCGLRFGVFLRRKHETRKRDMILGLIYFEVVHKIRVRAAFTWVEEVNFGLAQNSIRFAWDFLSVGGYWCHCIGLLGVTTTGTTHPPSWPPRPPPHWQKKKIRTCHHIHETISLHQMLGPL